jgi:parvulin-like peptidyl-prolyl isomerase
MSEGWRQVWEDIRHALRGPDVVDEPPSEEASAPEVVESGLTAPESLLEKALPPEAAETHDSPETSTLQTPFALQSQMVPAGSDLATGTVDSPSAEFRAGPSAELGASPSEELLSGVGTARRSLVMSRQRRWVPAALAGSLVLLVALFLLRSRFTAAQPEPPTPNVIATYDGGQITIEDVQQHLSLLVPDEALQRQLQNVEGYRLLVEEIITDELVRRWAAERKADRDENFQHVMKHITEEINLDELHAQMHQRQMGVTEGEIQAYYDANRQQFGDQTLTQARDQIRTTLQAQGEDQFVQEYTDRLRENATITRDFTLLEVPEPEERELKAYYEANLERYVIPAQAMVDEIRVPAGQDEAAAQERANKALARFRSGEDLGVVAGEFSETPFTEKGTTIRKGQWDPAYDEVVFSLDEGQISDVFRAGDAFYVVRLRFIEPERQQSLDEVREQVHQDVLSEKESTWFQKNADRTLFTIHGERYTVGEFWTEYQELPPTFAADYQGTEGRKALAERLIERLLLVEDSYDQLLDVKNKEEIEEMRLDVLAQMMEQEEVDDKIQVTDEEVRAYYEEHKAEMVGPPQARIRYIVIQLGQTEDERQRAWDKADEAYKKLVPGFLKEGADFAEIARQYSEDEATANRGGEMEGWVGEGPDILAELIDHPFHQQVLSLRKEEISQPFEWSGAIYIVQVLERKEPRPLAFEEVQGYLREELRLLKHDELSVQLMQKLMDRANVTIYDQALRAFAEEQAQTGAP